MKAHFSGVRNGYLEIAFVDLCFYFLWVALCDLLQYIYLAIYIPIGKDVRLFFLLFDFFIKRYELASLQDAQETSHFHRRKFCDSKLKN